MKKDYRAAVVRDDIQNGRQLRCPPFWIYISRVVKYNTAKHFSSFGSMFFFSFTENGKNMHFCSNMS